MNEERVGLVGNMIRERDDCDQTEPPLAIGKIARAITIRPINYGYVVTIGCQKFAIESYTKLVSLLEKYLANPRVVELDWLAESFDLKNME